LTNSTTAGYNGRITGSRRSDKVRESERQWKKENTVMYGFRLQRSTDAALIEYLDGQPKQTIIKAALREYIERHPAGPGPDPDPAPEAGGE
jgi:hypothetical protein